MVLACKIFEVKEEGEIPGKLKTVHREREEEGIKLLQSVDDVRMDGEAIRAVYREDYLIHIIHRGQRIAQPATREVPLVFHGPFLIVFDKKNRANQIANMISKELFISLGKIVEARVGADVLQRLAEESNSKVIFFDDIDIPDIKKLSLYGQSLKDTELYTEYLKHGKPWYVVFSLNNRVAGLTRNCVVTMFSRMDFEDFVSYVIEEILPLISG
jgi:hypothetical protein